MRIRILLLALLLKTAICYAQDNNDPVGWANGLQRADSVSLPGPSSLPGKAGLTSAHAGFRSLSLPGAPSASGPAETNSPEIIALANGLENDPLRIFKYVHDHIRYVLYFGSKKGAQLTLLEKSGNDFDQSALLVSLLRAAGYDATYQFGWMGIPYDNPDGTHRDLHHWLALTFTNTNWISTSNYLDNLFFGIRGYPTYDVLTDNNTFLFQRVWVTVTIGGTNFFLDPAFKVTESIAGTNLLSAIGFSNSTSLSNAIMSAASGVDMGNYVTNLNEAALNTALTGYASNFLQNLQNNYPNASVDQVMSGQYIVPFTDSSLPTSFPFDIYVFNSPGIAVMPVVDWVNIPTNLMSTFKISFAGTNYQWLFPQLQGQRLSLNFDASGVAQLWQEDSLLAQRTANGTRGTTNVMLSVTHPFGNWDFVNNQLIHLTFADQATTNSYQRTNASYSMMYAFEPDWGWLHRRQSLLDFYRQQGLSDTSRQVVNETLNVMGLSWMLQKTYAGHLLEAQLGGLEQNHHQLGRMAQEAGRGYYVDLYMTLGGLYTSGGMDAVSQANNFENFDLNTYFASALEHGIIEQLQVTNLVGASTIKMLEVANANGQAIVMASSTNWTSHAKVKNLLKNYNSTTLSSLDKLISSGYYLLLPQNGSNHVAGANTWAGYAYVGHLISSGTQITQFTISGGYQGGFDSDPSAVPSPQVVHTSADAQSQAFEQTPSLTPLMVVNDPVEMAGAAFEMDHAALSVGSQEPRGINFSDLYSSRRRYSNPAGMAGGWLHTYFDNALTVSAPEPGLGETTPAQMASMLVATCVAKNLYNYSSPDPKNWMVTSLIAKWGVDQLTKNSASVLLGKDTLQFIKQPNGAFTPPANCTMTLMQGANGYNLQVRHGNKFKFNLSGLLTNIVDQYGQSLVLSYNASNWVQNVTDWKGRAFAFTYSGTPSRLTSISDGTRSVSFGYSTTYSAQGDLISFTDAEGKTSSFIYDTNHQIIATSDALGQTVVTNTYDGFGRITSQMTEGDPDKTWKIFWSGYENVEQDPVGSRRIFYYDDASRPIGIRDALGHLSQMVYDGQSHIVMNVSALNETNRSFFDGNHNLLYEIDPLGFTNQFSYDAQNNLVNSTDPRGYSSGYGYNSQFSLTGQTNGAADFVNFTYNTDGTLATRIDSAGTTQYFYDTYGQLNSVIYPGGLGSESFVNNAFGDVTTHTDPSGNATTFQYNNRRQLTVTTAPTNVITTQIYDAVGNLQGSVDARNNAITNVWSATRKLISKTFPATPQGIPIISTMYDDRNWVQSTTDPLLHTTQLAQDVAERLVAMTDPDGRINAFDYDADNRKIAATNDAGEVIRQQWNASGELTKLTDGAGHTVMRAYDMVGNQISLTNRNMKKWQFQYDGANRLTNILSPLNRQTLRIFNNRGLIASVKKPSTQTTTFVYDAKARLASRTDPVATTTFSYDANNNQTNITENGSTNALLYDAYNRLSSYRDVFGNLIQYGRDQNGNLVNLIYPGGKNVTYTYDGLNRLTNVTDWSGRNTSFTYDLANHLTSITRPNGTKRVITYDAAGEATNIVETTSHNVPIALCELSWTNAQRIEWEFIAPLPHAVTIPTRTMTYNDDNQLLTVDGNGVSYDLDGNMTNAPLTNDTLVAYSYDARNRLMSVDGITNVYDPAGNRIGTVQGTSVTAFVIDPNLKLSQVLMRVKGGITNYYVYGLGLLYEVTESATVTNMLTYHYDYRGSTIALTDPNGNVTDRIEYGSYGVMTYRSGFSDTPFLFNGQYGVQTDPDGLLYMRARFYNPYLCRFINADPSGFSGGMNFYAYANGNPVDSIDPLGMRDFFDRAGQFFVGLGASAGGSALILGSAGPWGVVTAPSGGLGLTYGIGNMVAAFAPESANETADKMLHAPASLEQVFGYVVGGKKGQSDAALVDAMLGINESAAEGKILEVLQSTLELDKAYNEALDTFGEQNDPNALHYTLRTLPLWSDLDGVQKNQAPNAIIKLH